MESDCKQVLAVSLILSLTFVTSPFSEAQAQAQYSVELQGLTWNHSTISVLVFPQDSAPWWKPSYLNASLRAVSEWNNAIFDFASEYSNFTYLSRLRMVPTVAHALNSGFDIYVTWTENVSNAGTDEIGYSQTVYQSPCTIINDTIGLASKDTSGYVLNEVDMQNIAIHELGHALGLGHSNYIGDVMYPKYTPQQTVKGLSTLDIYGVSTVFEWMSKSTSFNQAAPCPQTGSVTLQSSIPYQYLPISYEDLPPLPSSQSPLFDIVQFIMRPETLVIILIVLAALTILALTQRREKKPQEIPVEEIPSQSFRKS